jgi:hypothetical protein
VTWSWCDSPRARAPNMACQSTTVPVPPASHPSGGRRLAGVRRQNAELPQLPSMAAGRDGRSMLNPGRAPPSSVLRCAWNRRAHTVCGRPRRFCRAVIAGANHRRPANCHRRKGPGCRGHLERTAAIPAEPKGAKQRTRSSKEQRTSERANEGPENADLLAATLILCLPLPRHPSGCCQVWFQTVR